MKNIIFDKLKTMILSVANVKYPPVRIRTYSLEYYLDKFILILNDSVKWFTLTSFKQHLIKMNFIGKLFKMNLINCLNMVYLRMHSISLWLANIFQQQILKNQKK